MSLIDATDDHHCGQDLKIGDVAGITGKKRFHRVWLVGLNNDIDPGTRDVDPWQCVDDLVDLHDHNSRRGRRQPPQSPEYPQCWGL